MRSASSARFAESDENVRCGGSHSAFDLREAMVTARCFEDQLAATALDAMVDHVDAEHRMLEQLVQRIFSKCLEHLVL